MKNTLQADFLRLWKKFFGQARLPLAYYYTAEKPSEGEISKGKNSACIVAYLHQALEGKPLYFSAETVSCSGGKRYLGFKREFRPNFEYFLSCGLEGVVEGERYKKSPEIVKALLEKMEVFTAPAPYLVFKGFDKLTPDENPDVVVFLSPPDVLSGLFTLANFPRIEPDGVVAPHGSGCASIVAYPMLEKKKENPRGILGMFDVSARPYVDANVLSLAVPFSVFEEMVSDMPESFLITKSWEKIFKRMEK